VTRRKRKAKAVKGLYLERSKTQAWGEKKLKPVKEGKNTTGKRQKSKQPLNSVREIQVIEGGRWEV